MTAGVAVKRRNAHQPVHAVFSSGITVGEFAFNSYGYAFDAGFVALLNINDFVFPAAAFKPPPVHAHEH